MSDSPMRVASGNSGSTMTLKDVVTGTEREIKTPWDPHALDRMDRWAGQIAAAFSSNPDTLGGLVKAAEEEGIHPQEWIAKGSYDIAESLERERTKRMTDK